MLRADRPDSGRRRCDNDVSDQQQQQPCRRHGRCQGHRLGVDDCCRYVRHITYIATLLCSQLLSRDYATFNLLIVTCAGTSRVVVRLISSVCDFVCLCMCPRSKGKTAELSTPKLVHVYSMAVTRHALTQRSKGQRSRSHGYASRYGRTIPASEVCCCRCVLMLPAWECTA